ncbi:MAG TPA: hypothetical protein DEF43_06615 [Chloroflexus aurantiacus]|uniref:Uncharacterized protein n=1 Tax=Chloroflexus aurantiacus (strain ATCC 29366 / DSM 635 / J-10-fl) TaxID=324602 RepID=A9W9V2_CHLAA|nr:hypothetical protein Caur_1360 [Chloroflexus aurantiacus J-10-fl]RMG46806.1 MAG: hypothetical protein D6716_16930 [Chloroflexota bacterium]HBW66828.1 hypothetical protein [Chloroflexus aurantiacus]
MWMQYLTYCGDTGEVQMSRIASSLLLRHLHRALASRLPQSRRRCRFLSNRVTVRFETGSGQIGNNSIINERFRVICHTECGILQIVHSDMPQELADD